MIVRNRTWLIGSDPAERCRQRTLPVEGGDGSTLSLDFTTGVLDPRLTFTRSSTATYIGADGLVKTMAAAPTNDPTKARFDHDPTTLAPRGLLVEGQVATLNSWGEDYTNAYWAKVGSSVGATSVAGPDNVSTATRRIVESATTAQHGIRRGIATTAGQTYTVSVFVKPGSYDSFGFELFWSASYNAKAEVTSISGDTQTVTSASGVNATLTRTVLAASGWYRYALTFTHPLAVGAATPDFNVFVKQTAAYAGNGTNYMDVYGFMLEAGSGASSYIQTGASTGTRNADNCYIYDTTSSGGLSWFKTATQGTFYVEMFKRTAGTAFAAAGFGTRATAFQEFMLYQAVGNNWLSFNWGAGEYTTNYSALSSPFLIKAAVALSPSTPTTEADSTVSINGSNSALNTGPNIALPFTSDLFCIGSRGPAGGTAPSQNYAETAIRRIKFFPFAMTAAQMNALTTL